MENAQLPVAESAKCDIQISAFAKIADGAAVGANGWQDHLPFRRYAASVIGVNIAAMVQEHRILKTIRHQHVGDPTVKEIAHGGIHRGMPGQSNPAFWLIAVFPTQINLDVFSALQSVHFMIGHHDLVAFRLFQAPFQLFRYGLRARLAKEPPAPPILRRGKKSPLDRPDVLSLWKPFL